ncbi:MAG: hypothetical protein JWN25_2339, partial [Verrucomicrobiales bacterium]|nr:hypothetical protein [Verrucomicrobiales bacterium]
EKPSSLPLEFVITHIFGRQKGVDSEYLRDPSTTDDGPFHARTEGTTGERFSRGSVQPVAPRVAGRWVAQHLGPAAQGHQ